ncbi:MAG TPA: sulfite exporter TauE/SafE family protein [Nitrososphaeraceae archaeon]|nr:sulfite exporter TauE/SafE family protein [Nitrososphaeraceae archaeon]
MQLLLGNKLLQTINIDLVITIILVLLGFVVGFVGGMVGIVLGVLRLAFIILGVESSFSPSSSSSSSSSVSVAAGTNIGVSTFGAAAAAIRHFRQKNISLQTFLIMAATGSIGGFFGSVFTKYIPVTLLLGLIAIIVLYEAFVIIKSSRKKKDEEMRRSNNNNLDLIHGPSSALRSSPSNPSNISGVHNKQFIFTELLIGFGIGFVGGLVGLIIGSIRLPAMIFVLKMETKVAIGTNLAASSLTGAASLVGHLINGNVDFLIMITMGPAAMLGGYMGAKYTNRFSEGSLKLIIGIVLIVVTGFIIWRIFYAIG